MSCFGSSQNHVRSPPPTDNPCAAQITSSGITLHAPPEPRQDAPPIMVSNDAPVLPRSVLDDEAFFNTLLDEAAEDFKKQATETVREATVSQRCASCTSAFIYYKKCCLSRLSFSKNSSVEFLRFCNFQANTIPPSRCSKTRRLIEGKKSHFKLFVFYAACDAL